MTLNQLLSEMSVIGASESQLQYVKDAHGQIGGPEAKEKFIEDMKNKFITGANKGNPSSVKATSAAVKAAEASNVKIAEVKPSNQEVVTEQDVVKAADSKTSK